MTTQQRPIPYWIELTGPSPAGPFYRRLFGWDEESATPDAAGHGVHAGAGQPVAGVCDAPGAETDAWLVYFAVDDLGAALSAVSAAGGAIEATTVDCDGAPLSALCLDAHGARFALCLPQARPALSGTGNGSLCWAEVISPERDTAASFYGGVFGWDLITRVRPEYTYYDWAIDGTDFAGLMPLIPPGWPYFAPQWNVYFQVADAAATAARVAQLGGGIAVARHRIPPGWVVLCRDPHGALFSVVEFASAEDGAAPDSEPEATP